MTGPERVAAKVVRILYFDSEFSVEEIRETGRIVSEKVEEILRQCNEEENAALHQEPSVRSKGIFNEKYIFGKMIGC